MHYIKIYCMYIALLAVVGLLMLYEAYGLNLSFEWVAKPMDAIWYRHFLNAVSQKFVTTKTPVRQSYYRLNFQWVLVAIDL